MAPRYVLGLSAFYHDSAACLLRDGEIVAAAQEERLTRKEGGASVPVHAVRYCLEAGGISASQLAYVGFYDKPLLKFERILETYLSVSPKGFASFRMAGPLWVKEKLFMDREIRRALDDYQGEVWYAEHHESHAASAFFPSPFEEAAILTVDGVGEWATASSGVGRGDDFELLHELHWPDSLGLLYSAFTSYTGFKVNSGEYKVMGLAPYGKPKYAQAIYDHLLDLKPDGTFRLNMDYFNYCTGLTMTSRRFDALFGGPPREPEAPLTQREMDLARSVQDVTEEVMLRLAKTLHHETGAENLCLAGGVALNCVGNGRILREGPYKGLWIQPAAGDAGGAIGAALSAWHRLDGQPRKTVPPNDAMHGAFLGPAYSNEEIERFLVKQAAPYARLKDDELLDRVVDELAAGKVVGWFHGRMEFGPRALGARSIIGDPRNPTMQSDMN